MHRPPQSAPQSTCQKAVQSHGLSARPRTSMRNALCTNPADSVRILLLLHQLFASHAHAPPHSVVAMNCVGRLPGPQARRAFCECGMQPSPLHLPLWRVTAATSAPEGACRRRFSGRRAAAAGEGRWNHPALYTADEAVRGKGNSCQPDLALFLQLPSHQPSPRSPTPSPPPSPTPSSTSRHPLSLHAPARSSPSAPTGTCAMSRSATLSGTAATRACGTSSLSERLVRRCVRGLHAAQALLHVPVRRTANSAHRKS